MTTDIEKLAERADRVNDLARQAYREATELVAKNWQSMGGDLAEPWQPIAAALRSERARAEAAEARANSEHEARVKAEAELARCGKENCFGHDTGPDVKRWVAESALHAAEARALAAERRIAELEMIVGAAQNKAERDQDRAYEASCRALAAERSRDEAVSWVKVLADLAENLADQQAMPDRSHENKLLGAYEFLSTLPPAPPAPEDAGPTLSGDQNG